MVPNSKFSSCLPVWLCWHHQKSLPKDRFTLAIPGDHFLIELMQDFDICRLNGLQIILRQHQDWESLKIDELREFFGFSGFRILLNTCLQQNSNENQQCLPLLPRPEKGSEAETCCSIIWIPYCDSESAIPGCIKSRTLSPDRGNPSQIS